MTYDRPDPLTPTRPRRAPRAPGLIISAIILAASASFSAARDRDTVVDTPNPGGLLRTVTVNGNTFDVDNPFFQNLGTNGRSCASCHVPSTGWTISPAEVRERFDRTDGLDPIFRRVDGSNSPTADVSSLAARRAAYSMLLNRGLIRVGIPMPPNADFELVAVDDPYGYASAQQLSLFRRPLPSTNLRFLTTIMWDGRESFEPRGTAAIPDNATPEQHALALLNNLKHQANGATVGHAEGLDIPDQQAIDIVFFELNLATAQRAGRAAGLLTARGARGGPEQLADQPFYVSINDVLGADVHKPGQFNAHAMDLFDAWKTSENPEQAAIARGAALFGANIIDITDVGGLNDDLNAPVIRGSCSTCHDAPNVGHHSVALPIDIGLTDASRRTPDMPLYTLRHRATGQTRQTSDPGRALLTGKFRDIGKFKGPVLRALASRPPYFHDGSATDLPAVIDFYESRFGMTLTDQEKADLVAFLNAL
jgi:cytochrome c peroxidase